MKVVINECHGGFGLSKEAIEMLHKLKGLPIPVVWAESWYGFRDSEIDLYELNRADPDLVKVVEELKHNADGFCACLKVVNIPDDAEWQIEGYDGMEWVAEKHRTWG